MPTSRAPFVDVVAAVREHTSQLLGRTIGLSDEDWSAPTALPGWTRSHVAAHLVDGARRLVRVIDGLHSGQSRTMYDSEAEERRTIELGALAGGLELQIQLDTTASELQELFGSLEGDSSPVDLRPGYRIKAWQIPLSRLGEVVLHEMDLDSRSTTMDLASETAVSLLAFQVERLAHRHDRPAVRLVADEGYEAVLDGGGDFTEVRGPAADLIAWLARGVNSPRLIRTFS
ncbi:maleylpyruvate isomerase family mycothiol-dependent enzyme [Tessaracoccus sp. MC1627]|uniref:maleylpyruvate isomerase family mycothiol-dependent enzyme n=1 Tax=Tessaracoccus sp. MC1627 TaxID=2760312 RepID=UPI0016048C33|nr:maleylpyruvate isomerase family mycothiol-dependent enzyme [Tessaracoccus sp. MC1627]MBB1513130.1 maleylpyruvate isomerase family mycothiol-dependent enzyme [Tessaracoccus sp. MC1627]